MSAAGTASSRPGHPAISRAWTTPGRTSSSTWGRSGASTSTSPTSDSPRNDGRVIERRSAEPLVRLGIFRNGPLVRANLSAMLFAFALAYGPLTIVATEGIAEEEQGLAGGLLHTAFQFGA